MARSRSTPAISSICDLAVDKSLVMFDHERGGARYGLLETIREFEFALST